MASQSRTTLMSEFQLNYPWMPKELASVWVDAYIEFGDSVLAWQEVRNGEGKPVYDQTFPGNRRDDGTLRLDEPGYLSTKAQYRNSLQQRGLNPEVFEERFSQLIGNEVSADEFEQRIAAVNENISQRSEEIRRAFAEAAGLQDFSPEATLAAVLDPEGVGRELLERRISMAKVRGTAAEFGFQRSQERVNELLARVDIGEQQARQFFGGLQSQLDRLNTFAQSARGVRNIGIEDLEEAALLQDQQKVEELERLMGRERAQFSSQRDRIRRASGGGSGLAGLSTPGAVS